MTVDNHFSDTPEFKAPDPPWSWVYTLGGVATLILLAIFLIGGIGIISTISNPASPRGWFPLLQGNWLVVLFRVNIPASKVQADSLAVLNLLDLVIMAVFSTMSLALYVSLRHTSRFMSVLAVSLPILGMPVFLITGTAGRSALLVSGLLFSIVMLRGHFFARTTAYAGIASSALLFFGGDIATAIVQSSVAVAALIGVGYLLWLTWLLLVALSLFRLMPTTGAPTST